VTRLETFARLNKFKVENGEIRTPNGRFFERNDALFFSHEKGEVSFPLKGNPYLVAQMLERSGLYKNV
jgi:hypothetical protein